MKEGCELVTKKKKEDDKLSLSLSLLSPLLIGVVEGSIFHLMSKKFEKKRQYFHFVKNCNTSVNLGRNWPQGMPSIYCGVSVDSSG
jgi:hypothetical protein